MQLRNVLVMLVFAILGLVAYLVLKDEGAGAPRLPNVWPSFATSEVTGFATTYKGSSNETNPSVRGSAVLTAECAIVAEPMPASFENTAR